MKIKKNNNYISWNQYFMGLAFLSSLRSKDPNTCVGACIINWKKRILGLGYNGLPDGMSDNKINWTNNLRINENKYKYVIHAEQNAILNCQKNNLKNCILYVTHFPCTNCAKIIAQTGIKKIYYANSTRIENNTSKYSKKIFKETNVEISNLKFKNIILTSKKN